jgi:molybdate transport system substrate-binding protein
MRQLTALGLAVAILVAGCGGPRGPRPLTIFAASSTTDALSEVLAAFDSGSDRWRVNFASSSSLATLVSRGVEADIFLSASADWAERVMRAVPDSRRYDLLTNSLVVIVPRDSKLQIDSLSALAADAVQRLAIADPFAVPAGIYARRHLRQGELWERIETRIVATADVRKTLALVEQGAADAGIVYTTDASSSSRVRVALRLPDLHPPIVYPLIRTHHIHQDALVDELVEFICGERAAAIFERHGFRRLAISSGSDKESAPGTESAPATAQGEPR